MSWDWSMPTVISPATLSFSGSVPRNVQLLGLWGPTTPWGQSHRCHFAVALALSDLLAAGSRLSSLGVVTRDFSGKITTEPSVIGWMPSAQIYFSDPDGHTVEYITLLDEAPECEFVGSLSAWKARQKMV